MAIIMRRLIYMSNLLQSAEPRRKPAMLPSSRGAAKLCCRYGPGPPWRLPADPRESAPSAADLRHYVANATWLACIANHSVIPAKAGTYAAWVPAFAGMTILCGVCYIMLLICIESCLLWRSPLRPPPRKSRKSPRHTKILHVSSAEKGLSMTGLWRCSGKAAMPICRIMSPARPTVHGSDTFSLRSLRLGELCDKYTSNS